MKIKFIYLVIAIVLHLNFAMALLNILQGQALMLIGFFLITFSYCIIKKIGFTFLSTSKTLIKYLTLLLIFASISLMWTRAPIYGEYKISLFLLMFISFIPSIIIINKNILEFNRLYLLTSLVMLTIIIFLYGSPLFLSNSLGRYYRFDAGGTMNPIILAKYLGVLSIVFFFNFIYENKLLLRVIYFFAMVLSLIYILYTGSKGPLFSFLAVLISILYVERNKLKVKFLVLIPMLVFSLYLIPQINTYVNDFISSDFFDSRFLRSEGSYTVRSDAQLLTLESYSNTFITDKLIGLGIGDYGYLNQHHDEIDYPHNSFLEILYELGLVGIILFAISLVILGRNFFSIDEKNRFPISLFAYISVFLFILSLFSGDLSALAYMYVYSLITINTPQVKSIKNTVPITHL